MHMAIQTPFAVTDDLVLKTLRTLPDGRGFHTDILTAIVNDRRLTTEEAFKVGNDLSRVLSDMAKRGELDDSGRADNTRAFIYAIPTAKLPVRKSKNQILAEENERLKADLKAMTEKWEFVCEMRRKETARADQAEDRLSELTGVNP